MELFDKMLQREKEDFRRISNRLLSACFLCRANETSKSDYYFVLKYKNEFKTYLDMLGYRLEVNEELGVIQLVNAYNYNRMNLKLYESIILLILRILYDEKKRELSISDEVIVNLGDIQDKFLYMPSRRHRRYYEMIMDDFNMIQGESIFSGIFHETHKEVIEELFDRLAIDNDNNVRTLEEFTDYRTYMDYDIRILHMDGSYSLYSKVCEEKSGGETQTPFYVTVAASFVQLYGNNIGGEAAGLVMFDEAFNNMDDERIGGVLEFLRRLPLQIIIAAPPDKIQYISPAMEETLLVMTDEKVSYVEEYYNGAF